MTARLIPAFAGMTRYLLGALLFLAAAQGRAQIEAPDAAQARDAATWGTVAGLTATEAEAQLRAQAATIPVTVALEAEFAGRLAGVAVTHLPVYRIEVLLTGDTPVADRAIVAGGVPVTIAFRTGALATRARLVAALTQHQAAIRAALIRPPGLGVDARTGALAVLVSNLDAAAQPLPELEQRFADLTGVPVLVRRLDRDADAAGSGAAEGGARVVGNVDGHRYICTTGFVVTDGARTGVLTAAHCPDALSFVEPNGSETPLPFVGQWGWSFQDVQLHTSDVPLAPLFYADTARTVQRAVTGTRPRADTRVGDVVCHRGERSGYSCAEVAYVDYAPPGDLCGGPCAPSWVAVEGPTCRPGDSGGPVFDGTVALGILKGASYRADGVCSLYYYMSVDYVPTGWRVATTSNPFRDGEGALATAGDVGGSP
ncbi:hypothetical protein [Sphingomonas sp.]|uniref:hypothetical protein n=1 Tax=Sphingomonas sp. TaxID=28214 RepID=UPI003B0074DE